MYILNDYDSTLKNIIKDGKLSKNNRTGIETLSLHGVQCKYDVSTYFPILTGRKINFNANIAELLWVLSGSTNLNDLKKLGCNYWEPWRDKSFTDRFIFKEGSIGMSYGHQLRNFGQAYAVFKDRIDCKGTKCQGVDQLQNIIDSIKDDPSDRGLIINLWNCFDLPMMRLRPCAYAFQILITDDVMDGILIQRSADFPIGVPYNLTFYTTFLYMIAKWTGYNPGVLTHQIGDAHIYTNQIDGVNKYLETVYNNQFIHTPPTLSFPKKDLEDYSVKDFVLNNYNPGPDIKFEVAI